MFFFRSISLHFEGYMSNLLAKLSIFLGGSLILWSPPNIPFCAAECFECLTEFERILAVNYVEDIAVEKFVKKIPVLLECQLMECEITHSIIRSNFFFTTTFVDFLLHR